MPFRGKGFTGAPFFEDTLPQNAILHQSRAPKLSREDWSSLIGIVTAIIGNILISFALNTQRYAHIRLEREANGEDLSAEHHKPNGATNGEAQRRIADERATLNAQATISHPEQNGHRLSYDESDETDALLPKTRDSESDSNSSTSDARNYEKLNEQRQRKSYLRSPYWWVGIVLMVIGEAGNFLAYGFAPASIVSPLGVVALISNCLIAPFMLKEQFRKRDLLGVLIAVAGAITVVVSAKGSNPKLGPDRIWDLIKRWEFLTYFGITVVLIVILMVASNRYGQKTIMVDIGLVGLFGGYTALSTKGVASLFSYRLFEVFTFWISYLLVFVLVLTAVMQIKYVNRALQRFDSTIVIPTQFVTFTIFVVVGSAVLYRDFEKTTAQKVAQFVGGVFLTFLGVWFITSGRSQSSSSAEYDGDEEHEIALVDEEAEEEDEFTPIPSEPLTPKPNRSSQAMLDPATPYIDFPASFATASSHLGPPPSNLKKPLFQASASSPAVPKSNKAQQASRPQPDLGVPVTPSNPGSRPRVPAHAASDTSIFQSSLSPNTTPSSSSVPRNYLNRQSIAAGITPGPYLSPLNAGVRAVLSDSVRRSSVANQQATRPLGRRRSTRQRSSIVDALVVDADGDARRIGTDEPVENDGEGTGR